MVGVAPRFAKPHIFPGGLTRWGFRMQIVSCNVLHGLSLGGEFFTSSGPSDISAIKLLKKYNYTACYAFSGPITQCSRHNGETPSSFCPNTQDHPVAVHRSVNTTSPGLAGVLTGEYCLSFTPPAFSTAAVFSVSAHPYSGNELQTYSNIHAIPLRIHHLHDANLNNLDRTRQAWARIAVQGRAATNSLPARLQ